MNTSFIVFGCMISISMSFPLQVQEGYEGNRKPQPRHQEKYKQEEPLIPSQEHLMQGFWPSSRMIHLALNRLMDEVSQKYELNDSQQQEAQTKAIDRWESFLKDNRENMQPLLIEFLEMRLEHEPPSQQRVQDWAKRLMPVFMEYKKEVDLTAQEFRKVLNPIQQEQFDIDLMQMNAAIHLAGSTLHRWQLGEFDPKFFWEPPEGSHETLQHEIQTKNIAAINSELNLSNTKKEMDPILSELDAWELYVDQFIRDYKLDEGQRDAARSCLDELRLRAKTHRERYRKDIAFLEVEILTHTGGEKEFKHVKMLLDKLYGPIDDMFEELQRRINQIPTSKQREQAVVPIVEPKKADQAQPKTIPKP